MNFPVPFLKEGDIEKLLSSTEAKQHHFLDWYESFFGFKQCCFTRDLLVRLDEINKQEYFMNVVPIGTPKLDVLVGALHDSCKCYCLGLVHASIALSGVAAESITQMLWEMSSPTIKSKPLDSAKQDELFGRQFSHPSLSQYRRLRILKALGIIDDRQFADLEYIRKKRNKVSHFERSVSPEEEREAAINCFHKAMNLFKTISGIRIEGGKVTAINPYFLSK